MEDSTELKEMVVGRKGFLEGGREGGGWHGEEGEVRKDSWEFGLGPVKFKMFSTRLCWFFIV